MPAYATLARPEPAQFENMISALWRGLMATGIDLQAKTGTDDKSIWIDLGETRVSLQFAQIMPGMHGWIIGHQTTTPSGDVDVRFAKSFPMTESKDAVKCAIHVLIDVRLEEALLAVDDRLSKIKNA